MANRSSPILWKTINRQLTVFCTVLVLLGVILAFLYFKDRDREWSLRKEQANHRLELAYELISRDLERVRSDVLYIASQKVVSTFEPDSVNKRKALEHEFANLLEFKQTFQQIRLMDMDGLETVRVELVDGRSRVLEDDALQDKSDRYYFREAERLKPGEVFVSEFDLNQEHGEVELPLNPVIRFVTPVENKGSIRYLLVANYRGAPLLNELGSISLPGKTFLIRDDGEYLLGPDENSSWGWILGHQRSFATQFPKAWIQNHQSKELCFHSAEGAFAFHDLNLEGQIRGPVARTTGRNVTLVSYLPTGLVFGTSNQLLNRLLVLATAILLFVFLLTRMWSVSSVRREQQNLLIEKSEQRLRELSARLVNILEDERKAISREIHDQLGQQVTAINLDLKLARREPTADQTDVQLARAIDESEKLLESLHDFASRVRPVELDDLGLHDAVESHLQEFQCRAGIEFEFSSNIEHVDLPTAISENIFRLIQESLNNVMKHAGATKVDVSIFSEIVKDDHELKVCIGDNGMGATAQLELIGTDGSSIDGNARLGILGMRERAELMGGTLQLTSNPERGTTILVMVRFQKPAKPAKASKKETE